MTAEYYLIKKKDGKAGVWLGWSAHTDNALGLIFQHCINQRWWRMAVTPVLKGGAGRRIQGHPQLCSEFEAIMAL